VGVLTGSAATAAVSDDVTGTVTGATAGSVGAVVTVVVGTWLVGWPKPPPAVCSTAPGLDVGATGPGVVSGSPPSIGRPGSPGRPVAARGESAPGDPSVDWAACRWSGGASSVTWVGEPCVLGQAPWNGRTSLRSTARQVPMSAHAIIAPASHATVARVLPWPRGVIWTEHRHEGPPTQVPALYGRRTEI
jgi:hypothetical protein